MEAEAANLVRHLSSTGWPGATGPGGTAVNSSISTGATVTVLVALAAPPAPSAVIVKSVVAMTGSRAVPCAGEGSTTGPGASVQDCAPVTSHSIVTSPP